ncbi:hypothetical protein GCM10007096_18580 [Pullulanibacillus pueri]|uniref:Uncharacterized protein n=1 Tax=Pullulanibacillus pueri TaxID=1437324 RepID=A0A8J2ZVB6_9BACL|nr:hypothetical protein GCM10007096_18580 [Pullulanibacillus pueri]
MYLTELKMHQENEKNAECYWSNKPNKFGRKPLVETLINGNIEVVEIVKEFEEN